MFNFVLLRPEGLISLPGMLLSLTVASAVAQASPPKRNCSCRESPISTRSVSQLATGWLSLRCKCTLTFAIAFQWKSEAYLVSCLPWFECACLTGCSLSLLALTIPAPAGESKLPSSPDSEHLKRSYSPAAPQASSLIKPQPITASWETCYFTWGPFVPVWWPVWASGRHPYTAAVPIPWHGVG